MKKITLGCKDIAGIVHSLSEEYKRCNYDVVSISMEKNPYYNNNYDFDLNDLSTTLNHFGSYNKLVFFLNKIFLKLGIKGLHEKYILTQIAKTDYFIFVWSTEIYPEEEFLKYLKSKKVKIITLFMGDDIRDRKEYLKRNNITQWNFTKDFFIGDTNDKRKKLSIHEAWSDKILSAPDQSIWAKRSYFHMQIPMNVEKYTCKYTDRDIPIIIHCPTDPIIKGSDRIEEIMTKLENDDELDFVFKSLRNLPNKELLEEVSNADILIDQIILNGPGFLGFEAMLSGCVVACKFNDDSPKAFRPPVVNINYDTIESEIRKLILDKDYRTKLARKQYNYASKNNDVKLVAKNLIDLDLPEDYIL